ncbi:MAG TPA: flagellar export protein FliJ [Tepidisphaeraceae bacterium]|nr:flagellar export protein FliJ [Tepidisphaeraceae bacterium]
MAQFIFHLEAVLRHRKNIERDKQRAVAELQAMMADLRNRLDALDTSVRQSVEDIRQHRLTGVLDMSFLAAHRRFLNSCQKQAIDLAQQIAKLQLRIDAARRALAEAARDRKIIEKLKEKQYERWRQRQSAAELALLDEVGMQIGFANLTAGAGGEP